MKLVLGPAKIVNDEGEVIATLPKTEIEVRPVQGEGGLQGGGGTDSVVRRESLLQTQLLEGESERKPFSSRVPEADVQEVWDHFVAVMKPRRKEADAEEREVIRKALKVATVNECKGAINGCAASDFHMGSNDKRRKYNRLTQILKGRRGKETTRERIDFFLDIAGNPPANAGLPSGDRAIVAQHKQNVQRGHRSEDPETVETAERSEAWLRERGIETERREADGYPIFPGPGRATENGA